MQFFVRGCPGVAFKKFYLSGSLDSFQALFAIFINALWLWNMSFLLTHFFFRKHLDSISMGVDNAASYSVDFPSCMPEVVVTSFGITTVNNKNIDWLDFRKDLICFLLVEKKLLKIVKELNDFRIMTPTQINKKKNYKSYNPWIRNKQQQM